MRVLVTGTNAPQVGSERVPLKYATGCKALVDTLRLAGHEVDQRGVYPGEQKLYEYDTVICYLAPMNALTAQWAFGALWLLSQRPDAIVALDDWQTHQILSGARTQHRDTGRLYREVFNRKGRGLLDANIRKAMEGALAQLASQPWPWRLLAPIFPHGDVSKLGLEAASYHGFDPSPYWRGFYNSGATRLTPEYRLKNWVSASLLNKQPWLDKLNITWAVEKLGNKKQGQFRIKEHEVFQAYCNSWGVLSAPHRHAGSGWWRARYVFAADARAVLYGDPREVEAFGPAYTAHTLAEIEAMSAHELDYLGRLQAASLTNHCTWTTDQLREALDTLVTVG